jgi:hypothetical protein
VGPLLADDLLRLERALPLVRAAFPDQPALDEATRREPYRGGEGVFLRKRDGFCVFFRAGTGCTVHAAAGGAEKPLVCQMFPLQVVDTEQGLRLATRPTCLHDGRVWAEGPVLPGDFLERVLHDPRAHAPTGAAPGEENVLRLLGLPDLDSAAILSFLAERPDRTSPPDVDGWLDRQWLALCTEADLLSAAAAPEEAGGDDGRGPLHPGTETARTFAELRVRAAARRTAPSEGRPAWPEVPAAAMPWVRSALQRLVFLRDHRMFPSIPWALLLWVAAARWAAAAALATDGAAGTIPDQRLWERGFSTLLILMESPRLQAALLRAGPPFA